MYHIEIKPIVSKPPHRQEEWEYDLSFEELERRFLFPYRRGKAIVIRGRTIAMDNLHRIRVYESEGKIEQLASIPQNAMLDVTNEFITGASGWELEIDSHPSQELKPHTNAREVFVVHGRNEAARKALFDFLRAVDLRPLEWLEAVEATGKPSPYIGEVLDAVFSRAHAVVVLFTPDDEARLKESLRSDSEPTHETQLTGQARPNVLFEAGIAMSRAEERTVLVELGDVRPFSDIAGRHAIRLDNTPQQRLALAQRLRSAGSPVNLEGSDWLDVEFEAAVAPSSQGAAGSAVIVEQQSAATEPSNLSEDAKALLIAATKDPWRRILKTRTQDGIVIQTNRKFFGGMDNTRSEARWEQVMQQLLNQGLIEDPKGQDKEFVVTAKGFEVAEELVSLQ